ncbi:MAG: DUF3299 domain-containing protein [Spirosomataceae bacterium]
MKSWVLLIGIWCSFSNLLIGQTSGPTSLITWDTFRDISYQKKFNTEVGVDFLYPTFGKSVKKLNGNLIKIKGYMIPIDMEKQYYVLSKFPMSQCFFCGLAGPETILMLNLKRKYPRFKTDEKRTFCGRLRLNAANVYELNYILEEAILIE